MHFALHFSNGIPIYEQIVRHIKFAVANGGLMVGEHIPSVREAAAQLAVNPNTVARAYRELQAAGILIPIRGTGLAVTPKPPSDAGPSGSSSSANGSGRSSRRPGRTKSPPKKSDNWWNRSFFVSLERLISSYSWTFLARPPGGPMNPVVRLDRVSKRFGHVQALDDVSLQITPGLSGAPGANGAGRAPPSRFCWVWSRRTREDRSPGDVERHPRPGDPAAGRLRRRTADPL